MENYTTLIDVLDESIKKNGEKPLTNQWLLDILLEVVLKLKENLDE